MGKYFVYVILFLFIQSCAKGKQNATAISGKGVYINNEGDFNSGKGEVSFYDPVKNEIANNLFKSNNSYMLGDVAQSIYIKDSFAYIVVNNSQKVEVVKIPSFQHVLTIQIPNSSPRYFQAVNDSIAYITELYSGKIHVVNYLNGALVKEIDQVSPWTEHMIEFGNYVVVEERNLDAYPSTKVSIVTINTSTNTINQRYSFNGSNLNGIVKDKDGRLWLAVEQDSVNGVPPSLSCLNNNFSLNKVVSFPYGHNPMKLSINGSRDRLYFFDKDIKTISVTDTFAPTTSLVTSDNRNFYSMGIDPGTEEIYVSDALDYVQSSRIYRYDKNGQLVQSFTAGIISGNFAFNE